jgi:hypothetical protein
LKLVPPLIYRKHKQPLSNKTALALGAMAGAGFGIFEAVWVLDIVFARGFTWATVELQGWQALLPFWERFSAVGFHTAATALATYGWNKGKGWQFYLLVALLHIILNYSVLLLAAQIFNYVQVEIYCSALAIVVLAPALWLRWRRQKQEELS